MPRKKIPRDMNALAAAIVVELTGEAQEVRHEVCVNIGQVGGKRGGIARAKKLTPEQRKDIARKAALARWRRR